MDGGEIGDRPFSNECRYDYENEKALYSNKCDVKVIAETTKDCELNDNGQYAIRALPIITNRGSGTQCEISADDCRKYANDLLSSWSYTDECGQVTRAKRVEYNYLVETFPGSGKYNKADKGKFKK